ncbi:MAG: aminotransferase class I/II-fold pyridoxal phosphate-dependent enzyme [Dermatophilaceae bacterium]
MRILMSQADVTAAEQEAVSRAVLSGWVTPLGPEVDAFEAELAGRVGVDHALALSSGTAALHLGLLGVGVGPGTAVVVSSMTFAASANAIAYTGARPVFVDSVDFDGNVDTELVAQAIDTLRAEGVTVAAAMSVDLLGRCVDYGALTGELEARGIPLIEDAAEALGACHAGRPAGSFGRAAVLSFNGNKIMTTSGGGMLLSDDEALIARARYLSTQARQPVPWYEHVDIGYNYRLSNLLAALGRAQLGRLDSMIARRRQIRERYAALLAGVPGLRILGRDDHGSDADDNCWLTALILDSHDSPMAAPDLLTLLDQENIEARPLWKPMHLQPVFAGERAFVTGVAQRLFERGVTLPSGSALTDAQVDRVCDVLARALVR